MTQSQAQIEKKPVITQQLSKNSVISELNSLTKNELSVFEVMMGLTKKYNTCFVGIDTIADEADCSYKTAAKCIKYLISIGAVSREYRGYRKTYIYTMCRPFFSSAKVRERLSILFGNLKTFAYMFLLGTSMTLYSQNIVKTLISSTGYRVYNNKEYINKPCIISVYSKRGIKRGENKDFKVKGIVVDEEKRLEILADVSKNGFDASKISPAINKLRDLKLNLENKMKLCAFPEEALNHAIVSMKYATNINNTANWVINECLRYCKSNNMIPDWKFYYSLKDATKIEVNKAPTTLSKMYETDTRWKESQKRLDAEREHLYNSQSYALSEIDRWENVFNIPATLKLIKQGWDTEMFVAPRIITIIKEKLVSQEKIDALVKQYPFLLKYTLKTDNLP